MQQSKIAALNGLMFNIMAPSQRSLDLSCMVPASLLYTGPRLSKNAACTGAEDQYIAGRPAPYRMDRVISAKEPLNRSTPLFWTAASMVEFGVTFIV